MLECAYLRSVYQKAATARLLVIAQAARQPFPGAKQFQASCAASNCGLSKVLLGYQL